MRSARARTALNVGLIGAEAMLLYGEPEGERARAMPAMRLAFFGSIVWPNDPLATDLAHALEAPSLAHQMGTDDIGRDVFARFIRGARVSLLVGTISVVVGASLGLLIGEHELGWKRHAACRARNRDFSVLDRLTHHLESRSFELRKFIEKENAVVREAYFARIRKGAAA